MILTAAALCACISVIFAAPGNNRPWPGDRAVGQNKASLIQDVKDNQYNPYPGGVSRIVCHNEEFGLVKVFYGARDCPDHFRPYYEEGIQGPQGPRGRGPTGPKGAIGPAGAVGLKGDKGQPGDKGPKGADGLKGETGPIGDKGPTGNKGYPKGQKSLKGLKGNLGPQGLKGPKGLIGPYGPVGGPSDEFDCQQILQTNFKANSGVSKSCCNNGYLLISGYCRGENYNAVIAISTNYTTACVSCTPTAPELTEASALCCATNSPND